MIIAIQLLSAQTLLAEKLQCQCLCTSEQSDRHPGAIRRYIEYGVAKANDNYRVVVQVLNPSNVFPTNAKKLSRFWFCNLVNGLLSAILTPSSSFSCEQWQLRHQHQSIINTQYLSSLNPSSELPQCSSRAMDSLEAISVRSSSNNTRLGIPSMLRILSGKLQCRCNPSVGE